MTKKAASEKAQDTALPQLVFKGDFKQDLNGELKSGTEVTILFDSERLPYERSLDEKGKSAWTISAFYQFAPGEEVYTVALKPEKTSKKKTPESEPKFLKGVLAVPAGSEEAIIWFLNTGTTGGEYYDSDFGKNYRFPVLTPAPEPEITEIKPTKKTRARKN
jgi:hypothetical protein